MNKAKNLLYTGLITTAGAIAITYTLKVCTETSELSDKLEPLRTEFNKIARTETPRKIANTDPKDDSQIPKLTYDGKLDGVLDAKNQYAKDNGALTLRWEVSRLGGAPKDVTTSTPAPLAYNPFRWNDKINETAIRDYQKNNKYRTRK